MRVGARVKTVQGEHTVDDRPQDINIVSRILSSEHIIEESVVEYRHFEKIHEEFQE